MNNQNNQKTELVAVCHNIRSRHNVGSIFRTADGAGVSKIFLCGITPSPPHGNIEKVSLGAENYIAWEKGKNTWQVLDKLKKEGFEILALEQAGDAVDYRKYKPRKGKKIALVLGNEIDGLPENVLKRANEILHITMNGRKESLNVSVAFGVAVYKLIDLIV
ncbi:MAG: RNA methyltransferase [Candidatus Terrybacteria bacterium CG10_big_fil_rev_8_21_14_0_10_41_10]|uniref:RNA methyltransferase n=1 Tax=Candidatus Terrybacteria bacterium CG10_big_fil_rev_8_21_14_0_10_41_10 TaxID=1975026 RepID=A0A2M8LAJ1_9BACT|nr:MAG: RNA methyltransferase [Candidatus Terrybacteria bacterium CG10_big_fil_rev_8_21_14_0_10_41_10]